MKLLRNRSRLKILVSFYKRQSDRWFNAMREQEMQHEKELDRFYFRVESLQISLKEHWDEARKIESLKTELSETQDKYINLLASSIIMEQKLKALENKNI